MPTETPYQRRQRLRQASGKGGSYATPTHQRIVNRCQPYNDTTLHAAQKAMLIVRTSYDDLLRRRTRGDSQRDFDVMCHAIGVATLRAADIAGTDSTHNPMLAPLHSATRALERMLHRHSSTGQWALDGMAIQHLPEAIDIFEQILLASSPAQMQAATDCRKALASGNKVDGSITIIKTVAAGPIAQ